MKKFVRKFIIVVDISIWVIFLILFIVMIGIGTFGLFCKPEYNALAETLYHKLATLPFFNLSLGYVICTYLMFLKEELKEKKVE